MESLVGGGSNVGNVRFDSKDRAKSLVGSKDIRSQVSLPVANRNRMHGGLSKSVDRRSPTNQASRLALFIPDHSNESADINGTDSFDKASLKKERRCVVRVKIVEDLSHPMSILRVNHRENPFNAQLRTKRSSNWVFPIGDPFILPRDQIRFPIWAIILFTGLVSHVGNGKGASRSFPDFASDPRPVGSESIERDAEAPANLFVEQSRGSEAKNFLLANRKGRDCIDGYPVLIRLSAAH